VLAPRPRTPGTAFVEIYQNCNIFNDGAFDTPRSGSSATSAAVVRPAHGRAARQGRRGQGPGDLATLITGNDTWTIG
jgi:2-oxoglutarate ferredoxin oxidoreductase subunit beta